MNKKRALACNYCRRSKRRCTGDKPCYQCNKHSLTCEYSYDNRSAKPSSRNNMASKLKKQHVQVNGDDSENVLNFYVDNDKKTSLSELEAAKILGGLFGGSSEMETRKQRTAVENMIKVQGFGLGSISLAKETCDQYIQQHIWEHRVAADAFMGSDFDDLYTTVWSSKPPSDSSSWFYLYTALGIGSVAHPTSHLDKLSSETQALYLAAASLIGPSVVEGNIYTAIALAGFGHFSMLVGEFLSQAKFCKMALIVLHNLGYHRSSVYKALSAPKYEERLRLYWHTYTVAYYHSLFFNNTVDIIPYEDISAPLPTKSCGPKEGSDCDGDYDYLSLKIQLIQFYREAVDRFPQLQDTSTAVEYLERFHERVDELRQRSDKIEHAAGEKTSQMYGIVFKSLVMHALVCVYRLLKIRNNNTLRKFELETRKYIQSLYQYTILDAQLYLSAGWHVCHHVFMAAIMLIYCRRMMYGCTQDCEALHQAQEILVYFKPMVPLITSWISVLNGLMKDPDEVSKSNGQRLPQEEAVPWDKPDDQQVPTGDYSLDLDEFLNMSVPDLVDMNEMSAIDFLLN